MIEIRWVSKHKPHEVDNVMAAMGMPIPMPRLQYRQRPDSKIPLPEGMEYVWSEWKDVPTVTEDKP